MTNRPHLPALLLAALALCGGCAMTKKSSASKENTSIAGQTEDSLRQRWIDRRATELVAQGVGADAARGQAAEEFKAKFPYTGGAQK